MLAPALDRDALVARYRDGRRRTAWIFDDLLPPTAYEFTPIPLRHPFVFYRGHLPAFAFNTLVRDALGRPSIDRALEELFRRGIDPADLAAAADARRSAWPSRERVAAFGAACVAAVEDALLHGPIDDPAVPPLVRAEAAYNVVEHEELHHETLMYLVLRTPGARGPLPDLRDAAPPPRDPIAIPTGVATVGADRDGIAFGWDNEFDRVEIAVDAFGVDAVDVTNAEWLAFVRDGGPVPPFWVERDGAYRLRVTFGEIDLPGSWPVYVTHQQARAYCAWSGGGARLMTEPEFHRAAYGTRTGDERAHPWGDAAPDPTRHGNFGFRRVDPEPVGSVPGGASAFGVLDLVGNGWEWTATPFGPLPGFRPMASYPQYSADFFDGRHFVMKGASPVTSAHHVRRSFRNWFFEDYPYMFATFRRAYDR